MEERKHGLAVLLVLKTLVDVSHSLTYGVDESSKDRKKGCKYSARVGFDQLTPLIPNPAPGGAGGPAGTRGQQPFVTAPPCRAERGRAERGRAEPSRAAMTASSAVRAPLAALPPAKLRLYNLCSQPFAQGPDLCWAISGSSS